MLSELPRYNSSEYLNFYMPINKKNRLLIVASTQIKSNFMIYASIFSEEGMSGNIFFKLQ